MNITWRHFLTAAKAIVEAEKAMWKGCEGVMCGGVGGESTDFKRKGTGTQVRTHTLPAQISSLLTDNVSATGIDPGLATQQTSLFSRLMAETPQSQPGFSQLSSFAELSPTDYTGQGTLEQVAARDPFAGTFETDTLDAYRQRAGDAMAMAASGPDAVRGGDARTGIMWGTLADRLAQGRGQEVRQAQLQDLMAVTDAAKGAAGIEGQRAQTATGAALGLSGLGSGVAERGLGAAKQLDAAKIANLGVLQLAAELQGSTNTGQTDNFSGKGSQSGWTTNAGCCFIFLQALNGELPWYIELARFEYYTPKRRNGYKWMSRWLVPLMRRFAFMQRLVNFVIIKPFLLVGARLYKDPSAKQSSALLVPYCKAWLALWGGLGRLVK